MRNVTLWIVVGSAIAGAAIGIVGILAGDWSSAGLQLIGSCVTIFIAASLAFLCVLVLDRGILSSLMWLGIGACWLSALLWLFFIWFAEQLFSRGEVSDYLLVVGIVNTLAAWSTYFGLMYWLPVTTGSLRSLRRVTLSLASSFACILIILYVLGLSKLNSELFSVLSRVLGIVGIAGFGLTIVTVVLTFVVRAREKTNRDTMSERFIVEIVCPRCDTSNKLKRGTGKCSKCSLRIRVEIEEPRCSCGYSVYRLASDRCPECGRAIAPGDRWLPDLADMAPQVEA